MDKLIQDSLKLLGLAQKEIRFFEVCFTSGPISINEAAKLARLQRSTAYLTAQDLIGKGLIIEDFSHYRKKVMAVDGEKLMKIIANRQRTLRRQELELQEKLPELQALYQASEIRPKVKVYEGNNGLLSVWRDILSAKSEILLWTNQEKENLFFTPLLHQKFVTERIKKGMQIKVLAVNNPKGKELLKNDQASLRQTKLLPKDVNFSAETYIYDNKFAILDYTKDIIGIIIESEQMTNSHKAIFDMNWKILI
jgi:sugar-specific transcriptional regulator TrmB